MNKQTYLASIRQYFKGQSVSSKDINQVIEEYNTLYDEALESGFNHEDIISRLGLPESIYNSLKQDLIHQSEKMDKIVAVSPFISVISYMILGFGLNLWHPGWLVFLFIPILSILLSNEKNKIAPTSIFISIITFILIGYFYPSFYIYGSVIFIAPALCFIFTNGFKKNNIILSIILIITALTHQIYGHLSGNWTYTWLIYLLPLLSSVLLGKIKIEIKDKKDIKLIGNILITVIFYLVFNLVVPNAWPYSWVLLLRIPMLFIYNKEKFKNPVAYMPFLSVIAFFILGFSLGIWHIAWIVFLSIPLVAILTEKKKTSN